ncbi:MAG: quinone oxidoreductase [Acidobacteria bacterium]|nr:quinone oxidoreductase [Acidobacteriota bacterium]MBI3657127.1 quinone oxidoreductase [Acidobacteriota bacterium]
MKAIRFHELGGPEVLRWEEAPKPGVTAGEVLVKVKVVGVNFADTLVRRGEYLVRPKLPVIPGVEGSGIVEEVGDPADKGLIGRRVAFLGQQCYAEYTIVPVGQLIPLTDTVTFEDGAATPVQALTAYHLLYTMDQIKPGQTVLVHAAAGGVGLLAVQMAKQAGALVYGTTSTEAKAALVRQMGADAVILYNQTDFAEELRRLTKGRGVDLILDSVGRATMAGSLKSLKPFGHLICYGAASGRPEPLSIFDLYENSIKVSAFWLMTVARVPELALVGVTRVFEWLGTGKLRLTIGLKLSLAQAAEAHRKLEGRETVGKIILTVD